MPVASSECLREPARRLFAAKDVNNAQAYYLLSVDTIACMFSDGFTHMQSDLY